MAECAGIDVAKDHLDWTVGSMAEVRQVPNTPAGVRRLVRKLQPLELDRVVLEATGGYERLLFQALVDAGLDPDDYDTLWHTLLDQLTLQLDTPFTFEPFHRGLRAPFDYYRFGLDFLRPLVDKAASSLRGHDHLDRVTAQLAAGENVIFLANHQTEGDPQAIVVAPEDGRIFDLSAPEEARIGVHPEPLGDPRGAELGGVSLHRVGVEGQAATADTDLAAPVQLHAGGSTAVDEGSMAGSEIPDHPALLGGPGDLGVLAGHQGIGQHQVVLGLASDDEGAGHLKGAPQRREYAELESGHWSSSVMHRRTPKETSRAVRSMAVRLLSRAVVAS